MESDVLELDSTFSALQAQQAGTESTVIGGSVTPADNVTSLAGLQGVIALNSGAPVNGIQVLITPGVGAIVFSISGPGTMAQRNAIGAVADLNQTIAGPSIAEVQAISDKMDELLAAMRAASHLTP
jgi:hypothetical protein